MRIFNTLFCLSLITASANAQSVVINEVDYDQPSTDTHEFIELKNTGATAVDPSDLRLLMLNGAGAVAVVYRDLNPLLGGPIAPGAHFVICGDPLATPNCDMDASPDVDLIQNGTADALVLLQVSDSSVLDVFSYEGDCPDNFETAGFAGSDAFGGGVGGPAEYRSLGRFPDGSDSGNNSVDFIDACTTPGIPNASDTLNCGPLHVRPIVPTNLDLSVFVDPAGEVVWLTCTPADSDPVRFDVLASDGALIATRTMSGGHRLTWAYPVTAQRGRMLVVSVTTNGSSSAQRVVVP